MVVYLLIPTSNHNYALWASLSFGCISFDSYIKPQPSMSCRAGRTVVYLLIPTSNHNVQELRHSPWRLYIFWFLHQTTTPRCFALHLVSLYIFWFLHQTTTRFVPHPYIACCISFDSYIKPQHGGCHVHEKFCCISFDSYIKPQPVRFLAWVCMCCISFDSYIKPQPCKCLYEIWSCCISFDSYIKPQLLLLTIMIACVVYLLIPTSNHNDVVKTNVVNGLYIFWFLHQTTTQLEDNTSVSCCISFDSYIKPQPTRILKEYQRVVYLLIPTSNHNQSNARYFVPLLYIFWFLHQTTTMKCGR